MANLTTSILILILSTMAAFSIAQAEPQFVFRYKPKIIAAAGASQPPIGAASFITMSTSHGWKWTCKSEVADGDFVDRSGYVSSGNTASAAFTFSLLNPESGVYDQTIGFGDSNHTGTICLSPPEILVYGEEDTGWTSWTIVSAIVSVRQ